MTWPSKRVPDDPDLTVRDVDAYWSGEWLGNIAPSLDYEPEDVGPEVPRKGKAGEPPVPTIERDLDQLQRVLRRRMLELARQGVRLPDSILHDVEPRGAYL